MGILKLKPRGSLRKHVALLCHCLIISLLGVPALPSCAWAVDSIERSGNVEAEDVESAGAEYGAENKLKAAVESQRAVVEREPANPQALRRLASLHIQDGDFRSADQAFTRLLALVLDDPAAALPYAMGKWHLRQEYEAQAAMLRESRAEGTFPGNRHRQCVLPWNLSRLTGQRKGMAFPAGME